MEVREWLLTCEERDNPHTRVTALGPGDRLHVADWHGDPDEQLTVDPGATLSATLSATLVAAVERAVSGRLEDSRRRPTGRLRRLAVPELTRSQLRWALRLYAIAFDPDGRPAARDAPA